MLITATKANSNHIHCHIVLECFAAQPFENSSFRLESSAVPAATKLFFHRSTRLVEIPSSWLTVSTDSPLSKRSTASVFSWLENRACRRWSGGGAGIEGRSLGCISPAILPRPSLPDSAIDATHQAVKAHN
jgi:hypothetical protein